MLTSATTAVQFYFAKRRPLANGISQCGAGVGGMTIPLLYNILITEYTWRGTLLVYGGVMLNGLICAALIRPEDMQMSDTKKDQRSKLQYSDKSSSECPSDKSHTSSLYTSLKSITSLCDCSIFTNAAFVVYIVGFFLLMLGYDFVFTYLPIKAVDNGTNRSKAPLLITVIGATGTAFRLIGGFISTGDATRRQVIFAAATLISGLCSIISIWCISFSSLVIYAAIFGATSGLYRSQYASVAVDIVGVDRSAIALSLSLAVSGIAIAISLPIAGLCSDLTGGYVLSFASLGTVQVVSGLLLLFIPVLLKKQARDVSTLSNQNKTTQ